MMNKLTEEQERNYIYGLEKIIRDKLGVQNYIIEHKKTYVEISFMFHRHNIFILLSKEEQELNVRAPGAIVEIEDIKAVYDAMCEINGYIN